MNARKLVGECPTVVGMITASLEAGGSFDSAARYVAEEGPPLSAELFSRAVRMADAKASPGVRRALSEVLDGVPEGAGGYRQAVSMCMAASESSDREGMDSMLREASDASLEAVRGMGESYSASLNFPCMAVFAIGIMVPMILMSLMPMMDIGGMFGAAALDRGTIMAITLVAIPAGILLLTANVRAKNPFLVSGGGGDALRLCVPLVIAVPCGLAYWALIGGESLLLAAAVPACSAALALSYGRYSAEKRRASCDSGMRDCVYEIGNRMSSGENFESAAVGSLSGRAECREASESLSRSLRLCRGDAERAVRAAVDPVSPEMGSALAEIERCSRIDLRDAGGLAIALGRQFQNRRAALASLEAGMKSMTDMMVGTAMVFAPLVLGLSVAMMRPLSRISGFEGVDGAWWILGAYLIELCALIALLTSSLGREERFVTGLWRFCLMCPVSLLVFTVSCGIQLRQVFRARRTYGSVTMLKLFKKKDAPAQEKNADSEPAEEHDPFPKAKPAKWKCTTCGYVYDPEIGDPDSGIAPGTRFEDIPDDWVCPTCKVGKDSFKKLDF